MKKEEGITLVALVITIIILIILAAITIKYLLIDGFIELATQGSINYSHAQNNEVSMLNEMNSKLEETAGELGNIGKEPDPVDAPIGAYVNYTPKEGEYVIKADFSGWTGPRPSDQGQEGPSYDGMTMSETREVGANGQVFKTETDMKWKLWDYDDSTIMLIADHATDERRHI